jgi:uroporphyrinogen-III synthase
LARVLVTRPEPGASATARRLTALGHEPVLLPLSEIRPLKAVLPQAQDVDAVAITSANALRFLAGGASAELLDKTCHAVGARSAEAARAAGFSRVSAGEGDGAALAAAIDRDEPSGARILYLCGRVRRPEFEQALAAKGYSCLAVETYDSVFHEPDAASLTTLLGESPADFALVYSPEAAACMARVATSEATARFFEKTCFLCLSRAVAARLEGIEPGRTRWSDMPSEDALLALLPLA